MLDPWSFSKIMHSCIILEKDQASYDLIGPKQTAAAPADSYWNTEATTVLSTDTALNQTQTNQGISWDDMVISWVHVHSGITTTCAHFRLPFIAVAQH